MLTDDELQNIYQAIEDKQVTLRDAAIVITGLSCGTQTSLIFQHFFNLICFGLHNQQSLYSNQHFL